MKCLGGTKTARFIKVCINGPCKAEIDAFDPLWYLRTYEDVRRSALDPLDHFIRWGYAEGRHGRSALALELDHILWRGFEGNALPALRDLLVSGAPREKQLAGWVLARWEADQGNWEAARLSILEFLSPADGQYAIHHHDPFLLGVQACLIMDDIIEAERILADGLRLFGAGPDFLLAQMLCDKAKSGSNMAISDNLATLYLGTGLPEVRLNKGDGSRFDRLSVGSQPTFPDGDDAPLVSVIVPVYNGEAVLEHALNGLACQSWRALEVLIVDDGSTDDTVKIARNWVEKDPRFKLIELGENNGAYPARNAGVEQAKGAFITIHDADDWSHPSKIQQQVQTLIDNAEYKASVSHWVRADDDLNMTRWRIEDGWIYRNVSSLMIRAELRDQLGYWDRVRVDADTEYYYRIKTAFGDDAICEVCPNIPLAFGRTSQASLTMGHETHLRTSLFGLRRDYFDAARYWHSQAASLKDLYLPQNPSTRPFRISPEIGVGDANGEASDFDTLAASEHFDARWYYQNYRDVLQADVNPVHHYLEVGADENRDPGPTFSSGGYRAANGLKADEIPLLHWEHHGRAAGANPLPVFSGTLAKQRSFIWKKPCTLVFAHISGESLFGAERSLLATIKCMADKGERPVVVLPAFNNPEYLAQLLEITFAVEVLPQKFRYAMHPPSEVTIESIQALIRKYKARELHVNTLVLEAPLIAARRAGCKSTVHVRELPDTDPTLCQCMGTDASSLHRKLLEQADYFVANSELVARWIDSPDRTSIQYNTVDEELFSKPFTPRDELQVALISSNIIKKGVVDFLAVARLVEAENRPVQFIFIGPPSDDLDLLRSWPSNVDFRGYASRPLIAVEQADVVMSLSKFTESFGRTVLEAMAAGRPVICYNRGTPAKLVESGTSGFVVPADDIQAAANAVLALEAARNQLTVMSSAARTRARILQDQAAL